MRAKKEFNLFISNEDINDITEIIKLLEDSIVPIKDEIKKLEVGFLGALLALLASSLLQPLFSSVGKDEEELEGLYEQDIWLRKEDIKMKMFSSAPSFNQY